MDGVSGGFTALAVALCLGGCGLIALFLSTILPLWALADNLLSSERSKGERLVWLVLLLLTWTIAAVVYGCFRGRSRALRVVAWSGCLTLTALVPMTVYLAGSTRAVVKAMPSWLEERLLPEFEDARLSAIDRRAIEAVPLRKASAPRPRPFLALLHGSEGRGQRRAHITRWTVEGPTKETPVPIVSDALIRKLTIAPSGKQAYGVSAHGLYTIDPGNGKAVKLKPPAALDGALLWPEALAYDGAGHRVLVVGRGGALAYHVETGTFQTEKDLEGKSLVALCYSPREKTYFGLEGEIGTKRLRRAVVLTSSLARLGSIELTPPLPLPSDGAIVQAVYDEKSKSLVVLAAAPPRRSNRPLQREVFVFLVDPGNGHVTRYPRDRISGSRE